MGKQEANALVRLSICEGLFEALLLADDMLKYKMLPLAHIFRVMSGNFGY